MQVYSRAFLQSLPEKKKQAEVDDMIKGFWPNMYPTAENGLTSYFFDMTNMRYIAPDPFPALRKAAPTKSAMNLQTTMTNDEILTRFRLVFPECSVTYGEEWIETNASTKVLKRGITIDWS
jgi:hypothetical protein